MSDFQQDHNIETYRILVLEDDFHIQTILRKGLENAGFKVETAAFAADALQLIDKFGMPHLAIVDVMLPYGMDGLEFCETVHSFSDLPIIILSSVTDSETVIQAIDLFAEDYIKKPFEIGELIARVNRILKRIGNFAYTLTPRTQVDEQLQVDFQKQKIYVDERCVSLTPTETKLLYILMRNAGETVTTSFILRRMWPFEKAYEDRLRVCVYRLRRKLGTGLKKQDYIQSRRGIGYRFKPADR